MIIEITNEQAPFFGKQGNVNATGETDKGQLLFSVEFPDWPGTITYRRDDFKIVPYAPLTRRELATLSIAMERYISDRASRMGVDEYAHANFLYQKIGALQRET